MSDQTKESQIQETNGQIDYTKYPEGHEALKTMLGFLPDEETKEGLLVGFTVFLSLM